MSSNRGQRDKPSAAFATAVKDPAFKDLIANKMRMGTIFMGSAEVTAFLKKERAVFKDLVSVLKGT